MRMERIRRYGVVLALVLGGVAAGGAMRSREASAQAGLTQCFAARLYHASSHDVSSGQLPTLTQVPRGWTVVGGGQAGADPAVILCR